MAAAVRLANDELRMGVDAAAGGNLGRARVCARRAVGMFLQSIAGTVGEDVGTNAMANLRWVAATSLVPAPLRAAADSLLVGSRRELSGGTVSEDPLADAVMIINYFVREASL